MAEEWIQSHTAAFKDRKAVHLAIALRETGEGQFSDSTSSIIEEPSKVVRLLLEDTVENETAIDELVEAYIQQSSSIRKVCYWLLMKM